LEIDEIKKFLQETRLARLATVSPNNKPHVTVLWFFYEEPYLYISTTKQAKKARNIEQNKHVSIIIDDEVNKKEKCVIFEGVAEIVEPGPELKPIKEKLYLKYLKRLDHPMVKTFENMPGRIWIRIRPQKRISWDYSKGFDTKSEILNIS